MAKISAAHNIQEKKISGKNFVMKNNQWCGCGGGLLEFLICQVVPAPPATLPLKIFEFQKITIEISSMKLLEKSAYFNL